MAGFDGVSDLLPNTPIASALIVNGSYTPTFTLPTNISAPTVPAPWNYVRIGNIVTVTGTAVGTPGSASLPVNFEFSLPIASNFTTDTQLTGSGNSSEQTSAGGLFSRAVNKTGKLYMKNTVVLVSSSFYMHFSYVVL